jgi:hypothetical protein
MKLHHWGFILGGMVLAVLIAWGIAALTTIIITSALGG